MKYSHTDANGWYAAMSKPKSTIHAALGRSRNSDRYPSSSIIFRALYIARTTRVGKVFNRGDFFQERKLRKNTMHPGRWMGAPGGPCAYTRLID